MSRLQETKQKTLTKDELKHATSEDVAISMPNRQGSTCPACGAGWSDLTFESDQDDWNTEDRDYTCRKCWCRWTEQWTLCPVIHITEGPARYDQHLDGRPLYQSLKKDPANVLDSPDRHWNEWCLGGDIRVMAYVNRNGDSVVWYPEGIVDSGLPTLAVFAEDDEEWTNAVRWIEDTTFEQAKEMMRDEPHHPDRKGGE